MQGKTRRGMTAFAGFAPARTALALLALAGLSVLGQPAWAEALDRSPLPRANPSIAAETQELAAVKPRTRSESPAEVAAPVAALPAPAAKSDAGDIRIGGGFGLSSGIEAIPMPPGQSTATPALPPSGNLALSPEESPMIGALTGLPVAADRITKSTSNAAPPSLRHAFAGGIPLASLPLTRIRPAITAQIAGPETPRPQTRPDAEIAAAPEVATEAPRPRARPANVTSAALAAAQIPEAAPAVAVVAAAPEASSLRPRQRPARLAVTKPDNIIRTAASRAPVVEQPKTAAEKREEKNRAKEAISTKGSVCGVAAIKGVRIDPITSANSGCGLADGVKVTSISGVKLSQAISVDCTTAKALNTWVEKVAQPAYGGKLVELKIAGSYSCRPRNNQRGAKVSEHGRGKAVDISGVVLAGGKSASVLKGFDKTMRAAYRGACGIFGTTLGPGSDGFHEDHMHFDTASHRNGSYCR